MKNFNFRRFLLTLKWDAQTNIRYNVRHWLIMLTLFFFAILLPHACVIVEGDKENGTFKEEITDEMFQQLSKEEQKAYTPEKVVLEQDDVEEDAETNEGFIKDNKENNKEEVAVTAESDTVQVWTREVPYAKDKWEDRVTEQHWVSAALLIFIVWFYLTFSASLFLNNLTTKQRRIAFFSLPASHSEKLLARWIYAVPVWLLMIITALCVADVLRYAVQPLIGPHSPGLMITWLWETGNDMVKEALDGWAKLEPNKQDIIIATIVMQITGSISSHSIYILGSSLFPRFPWLITTGIVWVIASIFSIMLLTLNIDGFIDFFARIKDGEAVGQIYTIAAIQLLMSILFYVLAIVIYRRMQVINHKLINL